MSKSSASSWVRPATFVEGFHDEAVVRKMKYREVEHLGLVSILSFGGSGLGGMHTAGEGTGLVGGGMQEEDSVWWQEEPESDIKRATEILMIFLKAGGNLIDTSHWYGQGKSERLLGHALKNVPRKAYYIMSKVCRYDKELMRMFDFTYARTYQGVKDSLKRLQLDQVDVMQVHDPEFCPAVDIIVNETIPALYKAKEEGMTRLVGMTGYPIGVQEEIIKKSFEAGRPIHTSLTYCRYTLNDRSLLESGYWETCKKLRIAVVNASPISMGLLMNREPPAWHPATSLCKETCRKAIQYCQSKSVDISKLAVHFVLRNENIATTLVSTTSPQRCQQNIDAISTPLTLDEESVLEHIFSNIFQPAGNLSWENVELSEYWNEVGRALCVEKFYTKK
eukprot:TRINITY_DN8338_c0_g1_i1.p1 TRINITY_DN8338_c0_g1~~TRINITY_DN8338_c0_g1_i1.p1  ORF type:complete len:392 (+),score=88.53 TRINITY_DN8338_c0_g1_i1:1104-2279(+)